jgi:3'(2'), 5'-bisphosphate nucleotidase
MTELDRLAAALAQLAGDAGRVVMEVYATDFAVRTKTDASPVSEADERAEALLVPGVEALLPGVPVVAEEAVGRSGLPDVPAEFVLIDPVDGTREFVSRNGDFTVNVALVRDGVPVVGVVYAPARKRMFVGGTTAAGADLLAGEELPELVPMRTRPYPSSGLVAVASRSHLDERTRGFLERLRPATTCSAGSSLKFCLVAAGEADVYPRFGPTMEWDTAAGDAVLRAAGGTVVDEHGTVLRYGKTDSGLRNGPFVAWGGTPLLAA